MFKKKIFILAGLFLFLSWTNLEAAQDTITIGRVTEDIQKDYKRLKPFIDYVAKNLEYMGIKKGEVIIARNNQELIRLTNQGKIDIVTETPFSSVLFCEKAGMKILLRRWKKGVSAYYSVLLARKDSGINRLADLKGKIIAVEDPGSTSGYFLPKADILKKGYKLIELSNVRQKPPEDTIGYCFANTEVNIGHWVHKGWADAGALSNLEYEDPEDIPAEFMKDFKVIFKTDKVPRALMLIRGDIDPKLEKELKKVLINMKRTEEGKEAMEKMVKTTKFDEFPEGAEAAMRKFKEKYSLIKEEIEALP